MSEPPPLATSPGAASPGAASPEGSRPRPALRPDMTVRQVAADYPGCQEVLRRHGEPDDRPTKFGHLEPLTHFARRHRLDLHQLLAELAGAAGVAVDWEGPHSQFVHRPFIAAALAVTLSLGAGWGAWLLFDIAWHDSFSAVPAGYVVAHGAAQLWGFIALFVVGIALRYLPMTTSGPRPGTLFCRLLLALFLVGVGGGFAWSLVPAQAAWIGPLSGAALVAGATLFLGFLFRQVAGRLRPTWARLVLALGLWLLAWAIVTLVLRIQAAGVGPGAYSEPARLLFMELAIFGFALNAIYGFGQRLLSGIVGSASPRRGAIEAAFWLHNAGALLVVLAHTGWVPLLDSLGVAALTAGAFSYAAGMRGFLRVRRTAPRPEVGQGLLARYVQLAFFWLLASMSLLLAGDWYAAVRASTLPHAYLGAVRHALTVGFMTTLILGVGQRLLPVLGHTLLAWPRLVAPTFLLIATGNLWRVLAELTTPLGTAAFALLPWSSLLELTALGLFSANALRTMWPPADPLLSTGRVTATTSVAVLLAEHPWLEDHLFAWGLAYVGRVRSVPRELTLATLANGEGQPPDAIIARINELLHARAPDRPGA
jgi:hypothetical protein